MIPMLYPPFQKWAEGGSIYILSDLHFDDSDCKLMAADWICPEEQIKIINKTINDIMIIVIKENILRKMVSKVANVNVTEQTLKILF